MTRKGRLVLLATIVLYLAGAANDSEPAYTFASALLGILLAAYVLSRLAASGLRITRSLVPERGMTGEDTPATVEVFNAALIPKPRARVSYLLKPLTIHGAAVRQSVRVPPMRRGTAVRMELPVFLPWRGRWQVEEMRIEGSDPLGLFERPEPPLQPSEIVATPRYWTELPVPWSSLLAPGTRALLSAQRSDCGEYRSIREYVPGDDIRHVHWRVTAHRGKLSIKEYERLRDIEAQMWVAPVASSEGVEEAAEVALSAAATLAHAFAAAPMPTVVRAIGLAPDAQGPAHGESFFRQLVVHLAQVPYVAVEQVREAAGSWARQASPCATVYIISNSPQALAVMRAMRGDQACTIAVLTGRSAAEHAAADVVMVDFDAIAEALALLAYSRPGEVHVSAR